MGKSKHSRVEASLPSDRSDSRYFIGYDRSDDKYTVFVLMEKFPDGQMVIWQTKVVETTTPSIARASHDQEGLLNRQRNHTSLPRVRGEREESKPSVATGQQVEKFACPSCRGMLELDLRWYQQVGR